MATRVCVRASLFLATILPRWFGKFTLEGGFLSSRRLQRGNCSRRDKAHLLSGVWRVCASLGGVEN